MISDISLKFQCQRKSLTEFSVDVRGECPQLSKKAMKILLPFAMSYRCETGLSAVAATRIAL
jgi:hypothetical protein